MNIDRNIFQTIENYLQNRLNEEDRIAFEAQIKENSELRKEVEAHRLLIEGIQREALKKELGQEMKQIYARWDMMSSLTTREKQVLKLISEGLSIRKIAQEMEIGESTVSTHKLHIMRKLQRGRIDFKLIVDAVRSAKGESIDSLF